MNKEEQKKIVDDSELVISKSILDEYHRGLEAERDGHYEKAYNCYSNGIMLLKPVFVGDECSSVYAKQRVSRLLILTNGFKPLDEILKSKARLSNRSVPLPEDCGHILDYKDEQ